MKTKEEIACILVNEFKTLVCRTCLYKHLSIKSTPCKQCKPDLMQWVLSGEKALEIAERILE
jgi:hypothetical protein